MKVLHLGRFLDSNYGGLEKHVIELLNKLSNHIHVENLVSDKNSRFRSSTRFYGKWKVHYAASLATIASTSISPVFPFKLYRLVKKEKFEIVHLHFPDPLSCISAFFLPRNTKLVVTWHSDIIKQKILLLFYQPILNLLFNRVSAVIAATPAHFSSSTQLSRVEAHKRFVIPFGFSTPDFDKKNLDLKKLESLRKKWKHKTIVFSIGRLVYYKGFDYLIRAAQKLPEVQILIGGSGPLRNDLEKLADKLELNDRVKFLGRVSDHDLLYYYYLCDIYCMPSIHQSEAFGIVQVEAMFCSKPVICFELNNGVSWVNQHNQTGLVVDKIDPNSLADAIHYLHAHPKTRNRMGKYGRKRALKEFSDSIMCERTLDLYSKVLGS